MVQDRKKLERERAHSYLGVYKAVRANTQRCIRECELLKSQPPSTDSPYALLGFGVFIDFIPCIFSHVLLQQKGLLL